MPKRTVLALLLLVLVTEPGFAEDRGQTVFREARAYTVRIRTQIETPFIEDEQGSYQGAGFLVDAARGWVVTNAHVAGQSPSHVQAAFADRPFRPARKLYVDSFTDVAILEVEMDGAKRAAASIDCSRVPEIGEAVGVFGHPVGFIFTGTRGIISGKTDRLIVDLLQTDATVDNGNSGGPMIALRDGKIVGIASAGYELSKEDKVNFATPMKDVCRIVDPLRRGMRPDPPNLEFALLIDDKGSHTMQVGTTFNPERWPFKPGDRILSVGQPAERVRTLHDLVTSLRGRSDRVPIRIVREGREIEIQARPALRPSVTARRGVMVDGALFAPIAFEDPMALSQPARLFVQSVESGSTAETVGLGVADMLESLDGVHFDDFDSLIRHLDERAQGPIRVVVRRSSPNDYRWWDYHVRELPGESIQKVGPENLAASGEAR